MIPIVVEIEKNFDVQISPQNQKPKNLTAHRSGFDRQKKDFTLVIQRVGVVLDDRVGVNDQNVGRIACSTRDAYLAFFNSERDVLRSPNNKEVTP